MRQILCIIRTHDEATGANCEVVIDVDGQISRCKRREFSRVVCDQDEVNDCG